MSNEAMKLTFLGTRGYHDVRTPRHNMHTSLLVSCGGYDVMIDCGQDWLGKISEVNPDAIVVTHAHPDHADGLRDGAPCPVFATEEAWERLRDFDIAEHRLITPREPLSVEGIEFEAFRVHHSTLAPTVGYRIAAGNRTVFYVPDVVYIDEREEALTGVDLYVGDGATVTESFVRKSEGVLIGHTPVRTQLTWCKKFGIERAIITHFSSKVVTDEETAAETIRKLAGERGVEAALAYDGMEEVLY